MYVASAAHLLFSYGRFFFAGRPAATSEENLALAAVWMLRHPKLKTDGCALASSDAELSVSESASGSSTPNGIWVLRVFH